MKITLFIMTLMFAATLHSAEYTQVNHPMRLDRGTLIGYLKIDSGKKLTEIKISTEGTVHVADILEVSVHDAGKKKPGRSVNKVLSTTTEISKEVLLKLDLAMKAGNYLAINCKLKPTTNLLHRFKLSLKSITVDGKEISLKLKNDVIYRPAVKVRDRGDSKSKGYRIPGMVTTVKGTLLTCYDVRYTGNRDLQGHMDIGISRSTDKGQTWEPMRVALDMGEYGGLSQSFNGVSDACLVVNPKTARIFCFGLWMHGVTNKKGEWIGDKGWIHQWNYNGSLQGFNIKGTSQLLMSYSDDDGQSWSKPENLTKTVKQEKWFLFAPAPGNGIAMNDGTLVVPVQGRNKHRGEFSTIMWSKDDGQTWHAGEPANDTMKKDFANECAVVELQDGSLMLNARDPSRSKKRGVYITKDLGETWSHHKSHRKIIEPTCMASMIKHSSAYKNKQLLVFSNPNSTSKRHKMTIQLSFDGGKTWPKKTLIDQNGGAYSALTSVDDESVAIFYESSQALLLYQRLTIEELAE